MSDVDLNAIKLAVNSVRTGPTANQFVVIGYPVPLDVLLKLSGPDDRLRVAELSGKPVFSHIQLANGMEVVRIT